jgi:hypothetical protein
MKLEKVAQGYAKAAHYYDKLLQFWFGMGMIYGGKKA